MSFQREVNADPAPAAAGDFAGVNQRISLLAGPQQFVAAPAPRAPIVGNFVWGDLSNGQTYGSYRGEATTRVAFMHRVQQAVITPFLADRQLSIEAGLILTLAIGGEFWAIFTGAAQVGQKVFANFVDGSVYAAAAGTSTQTASVTASLASTGVLTVSAVGSGTLRPGAVLTGVNIPAGVAILSQLSGTTGGVGTYQTTGAVVGASATVLAFESVETAFKVDSPVVADCSLTGSIALTGILTVSAIASGALEVGQILSGPGVPRNTRIVGQITGTAGSTGTYRTSIQAGVGPVVASTPLLVASQGRKGKISNWG